MHRVCGLTLVELMSSVAILGLLLCFCVPLYQQHQSVTKMKFFEKELAAILTTARLQAFLLEKSLCLEPLRLGTSGTWLGGIRLRVEGDKKNILHEWSWPTTHASVAWFGFRSKHFISISAYPEKFAMNGYIQIGHHQIIVNRFGRIRS